MKIKFQHGFTLIELLVVVAIIGVLGSVVLNSLGDAKMKSRDTTRKQNLDQLVKATNLYYSQNGDVPGVDDDCISVSTAGFVTLMSPFITSVPNDPSGAALGTGGNYVYNKISGSTGSYRYCAVLEESGKANGTYASMCGDGTTYNYCVTQ